jgi:hypothetical protein
MPLALKSLDMRLMVSHPKDAAKDDLLRRGTQGGDDLFGPRHALSFHATTLGAGLSGPATQGTTIFDTDEPSF